MEENKYSVLVWIYSGEEYDQGVTLLNIFRTNRNMVSLFPGKSHRYASKLRYELCKSVGLDWTNIPEINDSSKLSAKDPETQQKGNISLKDLDQNNSPDDHSDEEKYDEVPSVETSQYPVAVRRIAHKYGELYRQRGKLHYQMSALPESNEPEIVVQRRDLLSQIKSLSARMEVLFAAKSDYLGKGILPDAAKLWPPVKSQDGASEIQLPDSPEELRRLKKNLQTYNVKDKNLLLYQSISAQSVPHPMPTGPRRLGIEKRMAARIREIERIDYKLARYAH